jgi:MoxR-like ATPase
MRMIQRLIEQFGNVKTGKDVIRAGVIPKDFPTMLALATLKRLTVLKDTLAAQVDTLTAGTWKPLLEKVEDSYQLSPGVIADKKLGHLVRFSTDYKGMILNNENYPIDWKSGLPEGLTAQLIGYSNGLIELKLNQPVAKLPKNLRFQPKAVEQSLKVSSLGSEPPKNIEQEIRNTCLQEFFPKARLEAETAFKIITGLLMRKDMVLYGPPGSGKTLVAKDIAKIVKSQGIDFVVEGCQANCNPYSLFDPDFAQIVPPCPRCMAEYDQSGSFLNTGRFDMPKPEQVKVKLVVIGDGQKIEVVEGTPDLMGFHMRGYKIPDMQKRNESDHDYDPRGFNAGFLIRTNNGLLIIDEGDKLRPPTLTHCLMAMGSDRTKPDELRYEYPSHSTIILTANDITVFPPAFNDRALFIPIRYPESVDVLDEITLSTYYGVQDQRSLLEIGTLHKEQGLDLRDIPMAAITRKAISALHRKFRNEYTKRNEIMGSMRDSNDARDAARAIWMIDKLFFEGTPEMITDNYAIAGLQFSICSRTGYADGSEDATTRRELSDWVSLNYPGIVKGEEDNFWCKFNQQLSTREAAIPGITASFTSELEAYNSDIQGAILSFRKVKTSYENPSSTVARRARNNFPLIDYLFKVQPRFERFSEEQVEHLVNYMLESRKRFEGEAK